jgi:hypothetical protein
MYPGTNERDYYANKVTGSSPEQVTTEVVSERAGEAS